MVKLPFDVLFDDGIIFAVSKPAGLHSVAQAKSKGDSVAAHIMREYPALEKSAQPGRVVAQRRLAQYRRGQRQVLGEQIPVLDAHFVQRKGRGQRGDALFERSQRRLPCA